MYFTKVGGNAPKIALVNFANIQYWDFETTKVNFTS